MQKQAARGHIKGPKKPVLQGNAEAQKKFQEVSQAYDTLKDPQQRAIYNQVLPPPLLVEWVILPSFGWIMTMQTAYCQHLVLHMLQGLSMTAAPHSRTCTPLESARSNCIIGDQLCPLLTHPRSHVTSYHRHLGSSHQRLAQP